LGLNPAPTIVPIEFPKIQKIVTNAIDRTKITRSTWDFGDGQQHIGIVSNIRATPDRLTIVHNAGGGAKVEDVLFLWKQIGHYRYF
jgi:uncharacterized protein